MDIRKLCRMSQNAGPDARHVEDAGHEQRHEQPQRPPDIEIPDADMPPPSFGLQQGQRDDEAADHEEKGHPKMLHAMVLVPEMDVEPPIMAKTRSPSISTRRASGDAF